LGGFVPKLGDLLVIADGAPGGSCYYRLRAWEAMGRRGKERRRRETHFTSFPHQGRMDLAGVGGAGSGHGGGLCSEASWGREIAASQARRGR